VDVQITEAERRLEHIKTVGEKVVAQEAVIAKAEGELATMDDDLRILAFWVEGFGKSGLKSFLLECELADINKAATLYVQRLLGQGAKICMSATRKLKSKDVTKEELTVDATIPGCSYSYAGASKGQKRRLDLSLLLALRDVATKRSGVRVSQFFADEVFDGVDKAGCETVGMLLQELSALYPITLITHTSSLKSIATRVLRVVHNGKSAALVAVGGSAGKTGTEGSNARRQTKG
jgi:DNA repair exonuclease SbcCD ATPase subunit